MIEQTLEGGSNVDEDASMLVHAIWVLEYNKESDTAINTIVDIVTRRDYVHLSKILVTYREHWAGRAFKDLRIY